jgi:hypothetical protein
MALTKDEIIQHASHAADNRHSLETSLRNLADLNNLPNYADDTAAASGGVPIGGLYRSTSTIKVRVA